MPELPEVETVMRGLDAKLTGRVIAAAALNRPDLRWPIPPGFAAALTGATVTGFRRRGKYIFMRLNTGVSVLIHLGMSGRMIIDAPFALHEHLTLQTNEGCRIGFVDPRRFGALDLIATHDEDSHRLVAELGPEPLGNEFNAPMLLAALAGRKNPIKSALLDQTLVAGIGNIYASEALFRAGISPRRLAGALGPKRVDRLVPAIKTTLTEAIAAGGSSLRDYVQPSGELGYFQHAWKVYDRAGQFCERCPQLPACSGIRRIVQTGRASFYCPQTQG
jgi:formamidopyrimidine-DNA glycosylase